MLWCYFFRFAKSRRGLYVCDDEKAVIIFSHGAPSRSTSHLAVCSRGDSGAQRAASPHAEDVLATMSTDGEQATAALSTVLSHLTPVLKKTLKPRVGTSQCHHLTLMGLALSIHAQHILELGHFRGDSTLPLLLAAALTKGRVVSVDVNPSTYRPPEELARRWRFHQGDALAFLKNSNVSWDLVFVDDLHEAPHVRHELALLTNRTRLDSVIVMHDTMNTANPDAERWSGRPRSDLARYNPHTVDARWSWAATGQEAFDGLDRRHWEFATVPSCHGLTLLRRRSCWSAAGFSVPYKTPEQARRSSATLQPAPQCGA